MVEQQKILTQGGIYLARLDPAKKSEIGKIRPIIILNSQIILNASPPIIFVCPLSSKSQTEFSKLHFELEVRDNLQVKSYALVEHCRSITVNRVIYPRLAQTTYNELNSILYKLRLLVDL
ncbi:type II toxin-antitoxin system PemK/MazF family toxin [Candidatus Tisiphia endosymbiont of Ditula angustiorana]|uniref:type II toxin-antitoxin system PemK/MazF family toxin n=1 Tax=Candidatus Tisiphia endosymbiont of Ditula angustiorana TaxID=3066272 RepID=UPI00312CB828